MHTRLRSKIPSHFSRNSEKIKTFRVQNFLSFDIIERTSKGSDLSKKSEVTVHLKELGTFIDITIPTTAGTPLHLSIFLPRRARSTWRDKAT